MSHPKEAAVFHPSRIYGRSLTENASEPERYNWNQLDMSVSESRSPTIQILAARPEIWRVQVQESARGRNLPRCSVFAKCSLPEGLTEGDGTSRMSLFAKGFKDAKCGISATFLPGFGTS